MATVTEPIALDKSLNTTEASPRNLADVLAEGIGDLVSAISQIAPQTTYDELDKLNDVQITSVTSGQVLKWNGSKWVNANESGGSGGHTIEDSTGTALTQRTNLQFDDLSVTDDSVNDATVVSASGKADKTNLSTISATGSYNNTGSTIKAGTYFYLDGVLKRAKTDISNGASFTTSNMESGDNALNNINDKGSVSVTADGTKTYTQLLNSLFTLIDFSKVKTTSALATGTNVMSVVAIDGTSKIGFTNLSVGASAWFASYSEVTNSSSLFRTVNNGTITDRSATAPASGTVFTLYY